MRVYVLRPKENPREDEIMIERGMKYRKFEEKGRLFIKKRPLRDGEINIFRMSYNILPSVENSKETDKPMILEVGFRIASTHKEFEEDYMLYDNVIRTIISDSASLDKKIETIAGLDFIETFSIM